MRCGCGTFRGLDQGGLLLVFDMDVPEGWKVTKPLIRAPYPIRPEFTPTKASGGLGRLSVQHATEGVMVAENPCRYTFGPFYTRTTQGSLRRSPGCPWST